jgi:hypothetical protein
MQHWGYQASVAGKPRLLGQISWINVVIKVVMTLGFVTRGGESSPWGSDLAPSWPRTCRSSHPLLVVAGKVPNPGVSKSR